MPTQSSRLNNCAFIGYILLVLTAAVAGSEPVFARTGLLRTGSYLLVILCLIEEMIRGSRKEIQWIHTPANWILLLLVLFLSLQWLPLPQVMVKWLSPLAFENQVVAHDLLRLTGVMSDFPIPVTIAYDPCSAMGGWLDILAIICLFWVGIRCLNSRERIFGFAVLFVAAGVLRAVLELIQLTAEGTDGTAELSLLFPMAAALWLAQEKVRSERLESGLGSRRALFQQWIHWLAPEKTRPRLVAVGIALVLMAGVILWAETPAGLVGDGIGLLMASVLLSLKKRFRIPAIIGMGAGAIFLAQGIGNWHDGAVTIDAIAKAGAAYPILGGGMGSGLNILRLFTPDAAQVPVIGRGIAAIGVAGTGLILLWGVFGFIETYGVWKNRRNRLAVGAWAGTFAALLILCARACCEPEISSHFFFMSAGMAAFGYAALYRQGRGFSESFFYPEKRISVPARLRVFLIGFLIVGLGFAGWQGIFIKDKMTGGGQMTEDRGQRTDGRRQRKENSIYTGMQALVKGLAANPAEAKSWYRLGKSVASRKGDDPLFYLETYLPLADRMLDMALDWGPYDPDILSGVAGYWVERSRMLPEAVPDAASLENPNGDPPRTQKEGILKFQKLYRQSLNLAPENWEPAMKRVLFYYPDEETVLGIVPEERADLTRNVLRKLANPDAPTTKN